jgi:hypothetical protein
MTDPSDLVRALRALEQPLPFWGRSDMQMAKDAADLIESLEAQLAASQRRERAAVADLEYACGSQPSASSDASICDICKRRRPDGSCTVQCFMNSMGATNRWAWRGPTGAGEVGE